MTSDPAPVAGRTAWRTDTGERWKVKGKSYSSHYTELNRYVESTDIGPRTVSVHVLAELDGRGEDAIERIVRSIKPL